MCIEGRTEEVVYKEKLQNFLQRFNPGLSEALFFCGISSPLPARHIMNFIGGFQSRALIVVSVPSIRKESHSRAIYTQTRRSHDEAKLLPKFH